MSFIKGKFYILEDICTGCSIAPEVAPNCIKFLHNASKESFSAPCSVVKQPDSEYELEQIITAMKFSCVESVRYSGEDPIVLKKLEENHLTHLKM